MAKPGCLGKRSGRSRSRLAVGPGANRFAVASSRSAAAARAAFLPSPPASGGRGAGGGGRLARRVGRLVSLPAGLNPPHPCPSPPEAGGEGRKAARAADVAPRSGDEQAVASEATSPPTAPAPPS